MQVVIVPIMKKEADQEAVMQAVQALHTAAQQAGLRCKLDASTERTPGWKFNHYEMKVLPSALAPACCLCSACHLADAASVLPGGKATHVQ